MYVASDALQGDRAIGIQPAVGAEQVAHHQRRHFRRLIQCRGRGNGVASIRRDRQRQWIGATFDDVHFHLNHALDFQAGDADFAVAHCRVQIAHRQQRTRHVDRQEQGRALADDFGVHIATMCIRRAAADCFSGGCGADDADHRVARQTQCIEEHDVIFRHRHKVDASGRETRSRYTRAG